MGFSVRAALAATVLALGACAEMPAAPASLSTVARAGFDAYQTHAFDGGYFATDLKGQTYAYAWLDRADEFDVTLSVCSPLGCTTTKRYGLNPLHAALTVCRENSGEVCTIYAEGIRRR
ncbi:hypothetical protein VZ95_09315 [Elstera litoralis]|uniref:Lipoprotein n=1 Tax=Elstera litoralis TaxID=552518 RepID=A0A0F3IT27_9PROT|nr:hypothetical protein [Elstera litoralis]KJV09777.1 hypothetical protein VZ95_09315 [Elstera litoralis]